MKKSNDVTSVENPETVRCEEWQVNVSGKTVDKVRLIRERTPALDEQTILQNNCGKIEMARESTGGMTVVFYRPGDKLPFGYSDPGSDKDYLAFDTEKMKRA